MARAPITRAIRLTEIEVRIVKAVAGSYLKQGRGNSKQGLGRWLLLAVAAFAFAWFLAWLLRSRGQVLPVSATEAGRWFGPAELERMRDFREPQRLLGLAALALELAALAALAWWATPRLARFWPRHPQLGAAVAGAALSLALALLSLPLGLISLDRAVDAGLVHQSVPDWLGDRARGAAITALTAAIGAFLAVAMFRRLGRRWWLGGTALVALYAIFITWLAPVVVSPLFNDFEPLPPGHARDEILAMADAAGVEVSDVLVVDAARRSQTINAYVTGLGSSRRVVVYDNALDSLNRSALRAILAHELSHVKGRDVPRGVFWVILAAPLAVLCVQGAAIALARRRGGDENSAAIIPALALCLSVAVLVMGVPGHALSRQVEARADTFAIELTKDPQGFIELQQRLAKVNLSDPDPPSAWTFLFSTHPPTIDRIGAAVTYRRERAVSPPAPDTPAGS